MKKFFSLLCTLAVVLSLFAGLSLTASAATYGDFEYEIVDGEVTITDYTGNAANLEIPSTIEGYPVRKIGNNAFSYADFLIEVVFPSSLINIGNYAFSNCQNLSYVTLAEGLLSIGYNAFAWCKGIEHISFPDSVIDIDCSAFSGCTSLEFINVSRNNTMYCSVEGVLFSKNMERLVCYPAGKKESVYTVPNGVVNIEDNAFRSCAALLEVVLPESLESIGSFAFCLCLNLKKVEFPDNLKNVEEYAFYSCSSLECISINRGWKSIKRGVFSGCTSILDICIPNDVTSIGAYAFKDCTSLLTVHIGDDVECIGQYAFYNCASLFDIYIGDSVTSIGMDAFDGTMFYDDQSKWVSNVLYIGNYLIKSKDIKGDYIVKSGTKAIADDAFHYCSSLSSISIANGVKNIGEWTFAYCASLNSITIPKSVAYIGGCAFVDCTALENVYYSGTQEQWDNMDIGDFNDPLTSATIHYNFMPVEEEVFSDLNGDGAVNAADALLLFRYVNKITTLDESALALADLNSDGNVNLFDAARLFYMANGLI